MPSRTTMPHVTRRAAVRLGGGGLAAAVTFRNAAGVTAQDDPSIAANKVLVRRVFEDAVNGRDLAVVGELFAPDFVDRSGWPGQLPGPAGIAAAIDTFHGMFPGIHVTIEEIIGEGSLVATRQTWRGTHPPKGTHVLGHTIHVFRIVDGQIGEEWSEGWDWIARRNPVSWS